MAISGKQPINVGLPNESVGSDSLYVAFNKVNTNFNTLFACASPYNTFNAGTGIGVSSNSSTGTITLTNNGVTSLTAGTGITVSNSNGNVVVSSIGSVIVLAGYFEVGKQYAIATLGTTNFTSIGAASNTVGVVFTATGVGSGTGTAYLLSSSGSGGTVTSVGINTNSARLTVASSTSNPIVANGNFTIDLATTGVAAGTYTTPSAVAVDAYGRVTSITSGSPGTVTSIGMISAGNGISVTGGPITTSGTFTIQNTGVTSIRNGGGLNVSGDGTGAVTLSVPATGGTVTSVGVSSSTLNVTNSPVVTAGSIGVELNANVPVTGRLTLSGSESLADGAAASLLLTASYFSTGATGETNTLAAGVNGLVKTFMMLADGGGDRVITVTNAGWKSSGTGTMTFSDIGDGCTLQYINSKWFCVGNNGVVFA